MALRTGYSTGSYSAGKYGYPQIFDGASAVSVTSVVSQANAVRVKDSGVSDNCSLSVTISGLRVTPFSAQVSCAAVPSVSGYLSIIGDSRINVTATVSVFYTRIMPFSAAETLSSDIISTARYKWIEQLNASETWTESDYRGD